MWLRLKENIEKRSHAAYYFFQPYFFNSIASKLAICMDIKMEKQRIVQELVPGKQISLAHIIANPDKVLYQKLGLDPNMDFAKSAIGVMTVSPAETAIIIADIAVKSSGVELGFVDRFSGSLIVTGTVSEVEASTEAILDYLNKKLDFTICEITRT